MHPYAPNRTPYAIAAALVFVVLFVLFAFGWWLPNVNAWKTCGAPSSFSFMRGVFERPSPLDCVGLQLEDR